MSSRRPPSRPSEVLALPADRPPAVAHNVPRSPEPQGRWSRLRIAATAGLVIVVGSIALAVGGSEAGSPSAPRASADIATEDAVVSVLLLYTAEGDLAAAVDADTSVFALPGPAARARSIEQAGAEVQATLASLQGDTIAVGTPGADYLTDGDHLALARLTATVVSHTRLLGFLADVHDSVHGGTGTVSLPVARQTLVDEVAGPAGQGQPPAASAWAQTLISDIDTRNGGLPVDAGPATRHRAAADAEWMASARLIGPAGGDDLAAFLNGIDPAVLTVLDGHPVAGPALRRLR